MTKHRPLSLKEELRAAGFRATPSRLAIAELLESAHKPLGTPALAEALVPKELDLATLYRTLKSFEEKGLVRHVAIDQRFAIIILCARSAVWSKRFLIVNWNRLRKPS